MLIVLVILLQVIIFIGLIAVFRRVLNQNVVSATQHLEELNEEYDKKELEVSKRLEEAKLKYEEVMAKAQEEAEREKTKIIKEAESEKDKVLTAARSGSEEIMQQADKSRQLLLAELEQRIAKEAINKACELIQNTLPQNFKRGIHSQWVKELTEGGFSQLTQLRIPEGIKEVKITSAFSLKEEERKELSKKLKKLLSRDVVLKEEIDPKVVAGLIVNVGSLVLDGSLKNKIQEQVENIRHESAK
jgi:F0F1-type ATP synthase delta subunit